MLRIGGQKVPSLTVLVFAADTILIGLGLFMAIVFRFVVLDNASALGYLAGPRAMFRVALVILVCVLSLYYSDLYDFRAINHRSEVILRQFQALGTACVILAVCYYVQPDLSLGRGIAALAAPMILAFTLGWRFWLIQRGHSLGTPARTLIVGTGAAGISVAREVISRPELNLRVIGFLDEKGENLGKSLVNPRIIGAAADLESIVARENIDRVVLSLAERRGRMPVRQLLNLKFAGVSVEDAHSFYERTTGRILLEHLTPSWLILSDGFRKSPFMITTKRILDICVSLFAIVLCLPVMGLMASAIWLESGSPILFRQDRIGLRGLPFLMLKFRSMHHSPDERGPRWAADDDHRITRVGGFIRKFRLDELPQFFNVLRGEMSLVGPRPEQPEFCTLLEDQIPFFGLRHSVRPGITGWAQIKYGYGASVAENRAKLEYDLFYIKHMSVVLDLAILLETVKVIFSGRGAK